jgi:hypothetical protein
MRTKSGDRFGIAVTHDYIQFIRVENEASIRRPINVTDGESLVFEKR